MVTEARRRRVTLAWHEPVHGELEAARSIQPARVRSSVDAHSIGAGGGLLIGWCRGVWPPEAPP